MNYLFVHQNFPGQFAHVATALARDARHQVVAMCMQPGASSLWNGVRVVRYQSNRVNTPGLLPLLVDTESKTIRAEAALQAALQLRAQGLQPNVIVAHPGWGESLFLKHVWPQAKLLLYCEFFYHTQGYDLGFDPAIYPVGDAMHSARLQMKNANHWLHLPLMDGAVSPTHFQAQSFPPEFRQRMQVIHDGVDTQAIAPNPHIQLQLGSGVQLCKSDEVVTFVNRTLEPYRGFHIFMRALPEMLRRRPKAHFIVVGRDKGGYGAGPQDAASWREKFTQEVQAQIAPADWQRVHFIPHVPRAQFTALLQLSTVHLYWTYPFVLSWSLIEAMSAGCAIVASNTAPLLEAMQHGETGWLVDFFDTQAMCNAVCTLLDDPALRQRLGQQARAHAVAHYDLQSHCLPRMLQWVQSAS